MKIIILGIIILTTIKNTYAQTYTGVATHFEALGTPYGGCGIPPELIDSEHFVALNVFVSPNTGSQDFTRPIIGADTIRKGEFNNGFNCGRWVKVTICEDCIGGINDGALGEEFCRGGQWLNDSYSGAELYMIVTDACGDNNGWCRDSRYHLDLHTTSLNEFKKEDIPVADMYPLHFNNRKISWEYVTAPNYSGDIEIYFMQGAQYYWPAIAINHLENGISKIEQKLNDTWVVIDRNSDMGQSFILKDLTQPYTIRIYDINNNLINFGKEYTFSIPASCGTACSEPATKPTSISTYIPTKTQTIELSQGWNLISVSVSDTTGSNGTDAINRVSTVFENMDVKIVKNADGFWKPNQPEPFNSLQTLEPGNGYLVYMNNADTLSLNGTVQTPLMASLSPGWHMIGYPGCTDAMPCSSTPFSDYFDTTNCQTIKNFDGFWQPNGTLNSIENFEPSKGYFILK
jgi:hypothetical protein